MGRCSNLSNLKIGIPVVVASRKAVYQTGNKEYLRRKMSRTILLYGSSSRNGSRRLVSMWA
jgi:hypothetical protein